jgi:hypothetical protein
MAIAWVLHIGHAARWCSEWPGGLVRVLQLLEPRRDVGAVVIETNEKVLAEIGKHARRGDLEASSSH